MSRLRDKSILITGAAGGIGSAIATAIAREGGRAILTDVAGKAGIDHALDVTSEEDWIRVIGALDRLDGLVNAAGIAPIGTVEGTDYALWRKVMAVNLDGTFLGCKHGMGLIKRGGGSIVNISSVSGLVGGHNLAAYNASKGGVRGAFDVRLSPNSSAKADIQPLRLRANSRDRSLVSLQSKPTVQTPH